MKLKADLELKRGCQIYGHLFIKKISGNIHIGLHGKGLASLFSQEHINLTHKVNLFEITGENEKLTLGKLLNTNNLDKTETIHK